MRSVLVGDKKSRLYSSISDFEAITPEKFSEMANLHQIPDGFMFVVGVNKYKPRNGPVCLRCGKDFVFMQNFLPHSEDGIVRSRRFGQIYSLYEPEEKDIKSDDIILAESAIYQREGTHVRLILGDGECRNRKCIAEMFNLIRSQRQLLDFAPENALPHIYKVTFKKKSCGYFLKNRTYYVWAMPIGIPDVQSGEVYKGWLFADVNCGVPAIITRTREAFVDTNCQDGDKVSIFTLRGDTLVYEPNGK